MELLDISKSTKLIKEFLNSNQIHDFLASDPSIYIGGSLPFMCLSNKINSIADLSESDIGDIDIYTKNCPLLFRNINRKFKPQNIIKTGVNVKFNINVSKLPIQIITSPFDDFVMDVLDEYDCDMVSVGYHPNTSTFISVIGVFVEDS